MYVHDIISHVREWWEFFFSFFFKLFVRVEFSINDGGHQEWSELPQNNAPKKELFNSAHLAWLCG